MEEKIVFPKLTRYWVVTIVWYSIPIVLKHTLDIYSGWAFLAFVIVYCPYIGSVNLYHFFKLSEHMRKHYPEHPDRKNMLYWAPFSLVKIARESKNYPDEEFQYKAEKSKQLCLFAYFQFLIAWFVSLIYLN